MEAAGGPPGWLIAIVIRGDRLTDHAEVEVDDAVVVEHVHRYLRREGTGDPGMVGLDIEGDEVSAVEVLADAVDHEVVVTIDLDEPGSSPSTSRDHRPRRTGIIALDEPG